MDDKEIMKQFEDSFNNTETNAPVTPYRATRNMNTEISNPSMNVNNNMNVNIKQEKIDNTMTTNKIEEKPMIDSTSINQPMPMVKPIIQQQVSPSPIINAGMNAGNNNSNIQQPIATPNVNPALQSLPIEKNIQNNNSEIKLDITERGMVNSQPVEDTINKTTTYVYNQTVENGKKNKTSIKVSDDIKFMLTLILIILLFIIVMPTIYDFFRQIKLGM